MTPSQDQLLCLLSCFLFNSSISDSIPITKEIQEEAHIQSVSTIITQDYKVLASNIRLLHAHAILTESLAGIPFTTFKGFASAYYYPNPAYRPMGDVDFIVPSEHYETCVKRLIESGWAKQGKEHERHESFRKDKVTYELHSEIKGIPNGTDGIASTSETAEKEVRAALDNLIDTSVSVKTQHGTVVIPDDFHHGLIMLLHVAGHIMNDGGIGLRHICDWAVYVDRVDVSQYQGQLEKLGLWPFTCQLTALCIKYLGLREMEWAGDWSDEFLAALMEDVLSAGNFGRKEAGRAGSLKLQRSHSLK